MEPRKLARLTKDLRASGSQLDQLKVLIRRWNLLRDMSPGDRKQLARELGWDSAEVLVERLGQRDGLSPSKLFKAVREAERNQPGALAEIFSGLRDPSQRRESAEKGLALAEQMARSLQQVADAKEKAYVAPPPPRVMPPPPPEPEAEEPEAAQPEPPPPEPAAPPKPEAVKAVEPAEPEEARVEAPAPQPARVKAPEPARPDLWAQLGKPAIPRPAAMTTPSGELDWRPAAAAPAATLMRRFRGLEDLPERLEVDAARTELEKFPEGWARRRALARLLAGGKIRGAAAAAGLIATLPKESDRFWCAAAWLDANEGEDAGPLEQSLSPRSWKRLRRRLENL